MRRASSIIAVLIALLFLSGCQAKEIKINENNIAVSIETQEDENIENTIGTTTKNKNTTTVTVNKNGLDGYLDLESSPEYVKLCALKPGKQIAGALGVDGNQNVELTFPAKIEFTQWAANKIATQGNKATLKLDNINPGTCIVSNNTATFTGNFTKQQTEGKQKTTSKQTETNNSEAWGVNKNAIIIGAIAVTTITITGIIVVSRQQKHKKQEQKNEWQ